MPGFKFALRTPMGGTADPPTIELAVPDVQPGETLTLGGGRRVLVLAVVDLSDEPDSQVRALLEVEELPPHGR